MVTGSRHFRHLTGAVATLLMGFVCVAAQSPNEGPRIETGRAVADKTGVGSIRGRVVLASGRFIDQSLRVTLLTAQGPQAYAFTENQGWFEFRNLTPGNYEVQIESSGSEYQVVSQNVQVFRGAPSIITIALRDKNATSKRNANPAISVGELGADVPKSARKEFQLASKAEQDNKIEEAIEHLRKAISIYPNFVMARSDLGAQLLAKGKLYEAAEELRQAIQIDPRAFNPRLNLGIVLVQRHDFPEAAEVLERALSLNAESPAARLYAGLAQMGLGKLDEAEKHFKAAYTLGGSNYSLALFHLGQVYMSQGERELALKTFQAYLHDSPSAPNARQVEKLIAMLR